MMDAISSQEVLLLTAAAVLAFVAAAVVITLQSRRLRALQRELRQIISAMDKTETALGALATTEQLNAAKADLHELQGRLGTLATTAQLNAINAGLREVREEYSRLATKEQLAEVAKGLPTQAAMNQLLKMNRELEQAMIELLPRRLREEKVPSKEPSRLVETH